MIRKLEEAWNGPCFAALPCNLLNLQQLHDLSWSEPQDN